MRPAILIFSLMLVGCATPGMSEGDKFERLVNTGQCDQADRIASEKQSGAELYLLKAWVAGDCRKDRAKSVQYLTIAAKMGNPQAAKLLQQLGAPVPNVQIAAPKPVTIETPNVQAVTPSTNGSEYSRCVKGPQGTLTCYRSNGTGTKCRPVGIQIQCREL